MFFYNFIESFNCFLRFAVLLKVALADGALPAARVLVRLRLDLL